MWQGKFIFSVFHEEENLSLWHEKLYQCTFHFPLRVWCSKGSMRELQNKKRLRREDRYLKHQNCLLCSLLLRIIFILILFSHSSCQQSPFFHKRFIPKASLHAFCSSLNHVISEITLVWIEQLSLNQLQGMHYFNLYNIFSSCDFETRQEPVTPFWLSEFSIGYSQLSLKGHLYKMGTSLKWTPRVGPWISLLPLFDSP